MASERRPAIVYYSRTGTTHHVAKDLAARLADPVSLRIEPTRQRSYPNWLLRSFVPGSRVDIDPIETDLTSYDPVLFGSPKWTLSCPPVTDYLSRASLADVSVGLFLTFGGFDEERYAARLRDRLRERGARVRSTVLVKRETVGTDSYRRSLQGFLSEFPDALVTRDGRHE